LEKTKKNKILIVLLYIFSLFLFEVIIGGSNFEIVKQHCLEINVNTPFPYLTSFYEASFIHFIIVLLIVIFFKIIKKFNYEYRNIVYGLPLVNIMLFIPIVLLAILFCRFFGLYGFVL